MIFRILESRTSAEPTLDYNYNKVVAGTASIVSSHNLSSRSRAGVYGTFASLEHTGYPVKEVGFHMAVSPGPEDRCTEAQIIEAIYKTMYRLGYKDQPIIIFRHNDIERLHYHVVSSRISAVTGRKINNYNEGRKLYDYTLKIGPEYNFTVPDGSAERAANKYARAATPIPGRFIPGKSVYRQLRGIYNRALEYSCPTFSDLAAVLLRAGVRATLSGSPNEPKVILQGLDAKGNPVSAPISETKAGETWYADYCGHQQYHEHIDYTRIHDLRYHVNMALEECKTADRLVSYLKHFGIYPIIMKNPQSGDVCVKFIGDREMAAMDLASMNNPAIERKIMTALINRTSSQKPAKVQPNISFCSIARMLDPVSQPHGNSWNGKPAPTKEQLQQKWDGERSGAMDANLEDTRFVEKLK